jgi:hypothetical protein
MNPKLPYYMAYPMPLAYDDERIERRDLEYMKSLYPDMAKKILPYVEEECDRMEYECSMMYDEYPDKLQLKMMSNRIFINVQKNERMLFTDTFNELIAEERNDYTVNAEEVETQAMQNRHCPGCDGRPPRDPAFGRHPRRKENQDWMQDLVEVMLFQELFRRRCDDRRCRRRFY